jgi:hypothetical protein
LDSGGLGLCPVVSFREHGNELLGLMKGGGFLDMLNTCQLLKKVFNSRSVFAINKHQD